MQPITDVVKNLIIINVIVFIGTMTLPESYKEMGYLYFFMSDKFQPFQIVTSMFMHAGFQHLFFNMISLFFLGPTVERVLGPKRFFLLYIIAGLGATAAHLGVDYYEYYQLTSKYSIEALSAQSIDYYRLMNIGALGASGAVYGVVIAFATIFPNQRLILFPIPIPVKAMYVAIGLVLIGIISGVGSLQPGIAHYAHLGGALTGFILIHIWGKANLR